MLYIFGLLLSASASVSATQVIVESTDASGIENAIFVDARKVDEFAGGHIPGAANLDVDTLSEERDGVIGMLKPHEALVSLFASAGLASDKTLVVYSGQEEAGGVKQATRLFWALEYSGYKDVRFLNGGLAQWKAEGGAIETGPSNVAPLKSPELLSDLKRAETRAVTKKQLIDVLDHGKGTIVDLRAKDEYTGARKKDFVNTAGHIPSAKSKPATSFVQGEHFSFKPKDALQDMVGSASSSAEKPVITYCNSGRDATVGYVAYRAAGFENVAVYDGSMAEWGNDDTCPVADGEE